jgi:hypothetical protein
VVGATDIDPNDRLPARQTRMLVDQTDIGPQASPLNRHQSSTGELAPDHGATPRESGLGPESIQASVYTSSRCSNSLRSRSEE